MKLQILEKFKANKKMLFEIVAIFLIAIFAYSISPKTLQNDTYYTIKIGELITQNGIDMQDPFSWHEDLSYTYPHWLYDVIIYFIYFLGDFTGIYVSTCILAIILGVTIYKVNSKLAKNQVISFVITILSMYLLKDYIAARAQLVTFILFTLIIYNIEKFLDTKKKKNALMLIGISVLIANLHIAVWPFIFILFLPYFAEFIIALAQENFFEKKFQKFNINRKIKKLSKKANQNQKIEKLKKRLDDINIKVEKLRNIRENAEEPYKILIEKKDNTKWLVLIFLIIILTGLLTPLKLEPYTYLIKTMQGNSMSNINEHLPLTLIENVPIFCTIIVIISALTFTKSKIRISDLCMISGLAFLMFSSRRQSTMFILIGSIILNRIIINMFECYKICKKEEITNKFLNVFTAFVIIAVVISISFNYIAEKKNDAYISKSSYPVDFCDWLCNKIENENMDISNWKIFNEYNYGSYLLYRGVPVFIDSRADLYTPEFNTETNNVDDGKDIFSDFLNASNLGKYYGDIFEEYGITHVILYEDSKVNMLIQKADSEKYKLIYSDKYFVFYEILQY